MITRPTSAQLLYEVRRELAENIAPQVSDLQAQGSLQMVDHILRTLSVRAEHEIEWMLDEIDDISAVVGRVAASDAPPSVREALDALETSASGSLSLGDVSERYALASEEAADRPTTRGGGGSRVCGARHTHCRTVPHGIGRADRHDKTDVTEVWDDRHAVADPTHFHPVVIGDSFVVVGSARACPGRRVLHPSVYPVRFEAVD